MRRLNLLRQQVNLIWNYVNETSFNAIRNYSKWISSVELDALLAGSSKLLGLHSQTIQGISQEYVNRRIQHKKRKLRWRVSSGSRRSLGWVPYKASGIKIEGNCVRYAGQEFKFWNSWNGTHEKQRNWEKEVKKILCGSFSEDSKGQWYLNVTCEVLAQKVDHPIQELGCDPGLKDSMVFSDGTRIENSRVYQRYEEKLAKAQKARKSKQARNINLKIKNQRKDTIHKETTKKAQICRMIFVGDVSGRFLQKTNGKSSADAAVGKIRHLLNYKAQRHSGRCIDVSEKSSTITCSSCFEKTGPSGLSDLDVREWTCRICNCHHDRDINAARNILRLGRESLKQSEGAA